MSVGFDFKKTAILSLLIHVASMILIQIRIESNVTVFPCQGYRVSFLGSILDESSLKIVSLGIAEDLPKKAVRVWLPKEILVPTPVLPNGIDSIPVWGVFHESIAAWDQIHRQVYQKVVSSSSADFKLVKMEHSSFFSLEGEIRYRGILFEPSLADYFNSKPDENLPEVIQLVLRFVVSKEGFVRKVEPVFSSGNPSLDVAGMRYLRQWRFVSGDAEQNGVLKIHFSPRSS